MRNRRCHAPGYSNIRAVFFFFFWGGGKQWRSKHPPSHAGYTQTKHAHEPPHTHRLMFYQNPMTGVVIEWKRLNHFLFITGGVRGGGGGGVINGDTAPGGNVQKSRGYLMEVDAYPLLAFMRALRPQVIAGAVVGAVFAAVAPGRRRVPRVRLLCYRGGDAGVAAVWLRLLALRADPPRLIAGLLTVLLLLLLLLLLLRALGTELQCTLLLLPLLLLLLLLVLLLLQQWSLVSPT